MKNVVCISGFLGQKTDWDFLNKKVFNKSVLCVEEFKNNLNETAQYILEATRKHKASTLMGYSMGGRLALHALINENSNLKAGIIISSQLGLKSETEKSTRFAQDKSWSEKFSTEPWDLVLNQWNAQNVFAGCSKIDRREVDYNKNDLKRVLTDFSLAKQQDLRPLLKKVKTPILFVAGSLDAQYKNLVLEAETLNPLFRAAIIEQCGHRVIFDADYEKLNLEILNFLENL